MLANNNGVGESGVGSQVVTPTGVDLESGGYVPSNAYGALEEQRDYNNAYNEEMVKRQNDFNAQEAQKNREWQERMSNTAHQREVQDLINAGLNPVLSAMGQGAFTGSGAQASGSKNSADTSLSQGMISMMAAMISAASAQSVASMYIQNERYMAENYPTTKYGFINTFGKNSFWQSLKSYLGGSSAKNYYSNGMLHGSKIGKDGSKFVW